MCLSLMLELLLYQILNTVKESIMTPKLDDTIYFLKYHDLETDKYGSHKQLINIYFKD